jgi:hypothetical protein
MDKTRLKLFILSIHIYTGFNCTHHIFREFGDQPRDSGEGGYLLDLGHFH